MFKRKFSVTNIWSEIVKLIFTFIVRHYFSLQPEYYRIWEIKQSHKDLDRVTHPFCCKQAAKEKTSVKASQDWHKEISVKVSGCWQAQLATQLL